MNLPFRKGNQIINKKKSGKIYNIRNNEKKIEQLQWATSAANATIMHNQHSRTQQHYIILILMLSCNQLTRQAFSLESPVKQQCLTPCCGPSNTCNQAEEVTLQGGPFPGDGRGLRQQIPYESWFQVFAHVTSRKACDWANHHSRMVMHSYWEGFRSKYLLNKKSYIRSTYLRVQDHFKIRIRFVKIHIFTLFSHMLQTYLFHHILNKENQHNFQ